MSSYLPLTYFPMTYKIKEWNLDKCSCPLRTTARVPQLVALIAAGAIEAFLCPFKALVNGAYSLCNRNVQPLNLPRTPPAVNSPPAENSPPAMTLELLAVQVARIADELTATQKRYHANHIEIMERVGNLEKKSATQPEQVQRLAEQLTTNQNQLRGNLVEITERVGNLEAKLATQIEQQKNQNQEKHATLVAQIGHVQENQLDFQKALGERIEIVEKSQQDFGEEIRAQVKSMRDTSIENSSLVETQVNELLLEIHSSLPNVKYQMGILALGTTSALQYNEANRVHSECSGEEQRERQEEMNEHSQKAQTILGHLKEILPNRASSSSSETDFVSSDLQLKAPLASQQFFEAGEIEVDRKDALIGGEDNSSSITKEECPFSPIPSIPIDSSLPAVDSSLAAVDPKGKEEERIGNDWDAGEGVKVEIFPSQPNPEPSLFSSKEDQVDLITPTKEAKIEINSSTTENVEKKKEKPGLLSNLGGLLLGVKEKIQERTSKGDETVKPTDSGSNTEEYILIPLPLTGADVSFGGAEQPSSTEDEETNSLPTVEENGEEKTGSLSPQDSDEEGAGIRSDGDETKSSNDDERLQFQAF